ncbi:hypothetical protein KDX38_20975 [Pseudomonas sp. CDFA 602]|uniref:hypothetical protein n=1 Tax=Pseudomonas californiensis TaxID=2829823 RepID=UPI001E2BB067|nr:hypothetical protein [Pseudomonas californiensis]MCD5996078.1 hypothetical protein [Pseudomonas californiensis]MCD6001677.1 hypothetical protein [Pseudomonas californiensis]
MFRKNVLWRELETDGQGQLFEVDVSHWRATAEQNTNADQRDSVGVAQHVMLVPMLLQSRFVADQFLMAYSEVPWTWDYIKWLEADPARVRARCQNIARAWDAAVVASDHWKTTQSNPSLPMVRIKTGLRARDFNIESALEDPLDFTPEFSGFDDQMLIKRLQMRQEQLASHMKHPPPSALPETEAGADLLDRYNLQGNKHLVGVILDDPLFAVRHAMAQIRHCATYLQTLNALVPYHTYGRYAQVLYSILDGPLSSLKSEIDLPKLHEAVFEQDRKTCRSQLTTHLVRLAGLLDKKLTTVLLDWTHRHDEALLEPYSLLTEALNACAQLPAKADAMFTGKELPALRKMIDTLVQGILRAEHPLGALLLANSEGQLPEPVKRLQILSDKNLPPAPEAMGLSTLMLSAQIMGEVDWASAGKSFAYFMGDLLDILGASVVAQLSRLAQDAQNIKLDRVFAPSFKTLSALSRKLVGVRLTTFGDAMDQGFTVIGVQGGGLSNGLTQTERAELTRKNYRYASLHSLDGEKLGSTSAKGSYTNQPLVRNLTVIALPSGHPELSRYSRFRAGLSQAGQALEKTKAVPTLMLGFAVYNLVVQVESFKTQESFRGNFGVVSAFLDLGAAIGNHSKLLFGGTTANFLNTPRIDISKISIQWANNLEKQTGSPKLPLLRAIGGIATGVGALLSILDAFKALEKGRYALSAAYFFYCFGQRNLGGLCSWPNHKPLGSAYRCGGNYRRLNRCKSTIRQRHQAIDTKWSVRPKIFRQPDSSR